MWKLVIFPILSSAVSVHILFVHAWICCMNASGETERCLKHKNEAHFFKAQFLLEYILLIIAEA